MNDKPNNPSSPPRRRRSPGSPEGEVGRVRLTHRQWLDRMAEDLPTAEDDFDLLDELNDDEALYEAMLDAMEGSAWHPPGRYRTDH